MGNNYIITKGSEVINNSLNSYIENLGQITETTGYDMMAVVMEVTDGDTIQVTQQCLPGQLCVTTPFNVRLHGISSSEMNFQLAEPLKPAL